MTLVSFVSSGPGDPELLTLKAVERIKTADAILYDDLSSGAILDFAKADCDLVGVGKRAGRPSPKQNHVSQLLLDYAHSGMKTVRLKSGDSGIFGRLEEEISALDEAGIAYEIIPGISAAVATAAAAGIPLTRRLAARRVQFISGHDVSGELPDDLNIKALADSKAVSAVFMGKRTFGDLARLMMAEGLPSETAVLIGENISRPDQYFTQTSIGEAATTLDERASSAPAMILFGALATELLKL